MPSGHELRGQRPEPTKDGQNNPPRQRRRLRITAVTYRPFYADEFASDVDPTPPGIAVLRLKTPTNVSVQWQGPPAEISSKAKTEGGTNRRKKAMADTHEGDVTTFWAALPILERLSEPGETMTNKEIAEVVGTRSVHGIASRLKWSRDELADAGVRFDDAVKREFIICAGDLAPIHTRRVGSTRPRPSTHSRRKFADREMGCTTFKPARMESARSEHRPTADVAAHPPTVMDDPQVQASCTIRMATKELRVFLSRQLLTLDSQRWLPHKYNQRIEIAILRLAFHFDNKCSRR